MQLSVVQQIVRTFVPHHLHTCINHANVLHNIVIVNVLYRLRLALFPNLSWLDSTVNKVKQCIALFRKVVLAKAISINFVVENVDVEC